MEEIRADDNLNLSLVLLVETVSQGFMVFMLSVISFS